MGLPSSQRAGVGGELLMGRRPRPRPHPPRPALPLPTAGHRGAHKNKRSGAKISNTLLHLMIPYAPIAPYVR
eukprot:scaffold26488_cov140-Isochrysis_galbana.AAC.1